MLQISTNYENQKYYGIYSFLQYRATKQSIIHFIGHVIDFDYNGVSSDNFQN